MVMIIAIALLVSFGWFWIGQGGVWLLAAAAGVAVWGLIEWRLQKRE